jgi:hypothetical protein
MVAHRDPSVKDGAGNARIAYKSKIWCRVNEMVLWVARRGKNSTGQSLCRGPVPWVSRPKLEAARLSVATAGLGAPMYCPFAARPQAGLDPLAGFDQIERAVAGIPVHGSCRAVNQALLLPVGDRFPYCAYFTLQPYGRVLVCATVLPLIAAWRATLT